MKMLTCRNKIAINPVFNVKCNQIDKYNAITTNTKKGKERQILIILL